MKKYRTHILLFLLTIVSTTLAGAEWIYGMSFLSGMMSFEHFKEGLWYSIPFLGFLTTHEFGHYFMAKFRKVKVSLPYYIPGWIAIALSIGTFGAFIKIEDRITSKKDYFDIGIAGPLAGFIFTVAVLIYGFSTLPGDEYIYKIHPEYQELGMHYREALDSDVFAEYETLTLGTTLLYSFLENTFADPERIPHPAEQTHYPLLLAGFLGLLFTAINLLPVGQLDGGHVMYALVGPRAFNIISPLVLIMLVGFAGQGLFTVEEFGTVEKKDQWSLLAKFILYIYFVYLCFSRIFTIKRYNWILALGLVLVQLIISVILPDFVGYSGIILFGFLIGRVLGVYHPPTFDNQPIGKTRTILGWLAMLIFITCISLYPLS